MSTQTRNDLSNIQLKQKLIHFKSELARFQINKEKHDEIIKKLSKEKSELHQSLEEQNIKLNELSEQNRKLCQEKDIFNEHFEKVGQENTSLHYKLENIEKNDLALEEQLLDQIEKNDQLMLEVQHEVDQLKTEKTQIQNELDQHIQLFNELTLQDQENTKQIELLLIEKNELIEKLESTQEKNKYLEQGQTNFTHTSQKLERELVAIKENVNQDQLHLIEELEKIKNEKIDLINMLKEKVVIINEFRDELAVQKAQSETVVSQLESKYNEEKLTLIQELEKFKNINFDLQKTLDERTAIIDKLTLEKKEFKKGKETLIEELESLRSEKRTFKQQLETYEIGNKELEQEINEFIEKIDQDQLVLIRELEAAKKEKDNLDEILKQEKAKVNQFEEMQGAIEKENREVHKQIEHQKTVIDELRAQEVQYNKKNKEFENILLSKDKTVLELQKELEKLATDLSSKTLQGENESKQRLVKLQKQVDILQKEKFEIQERFTFFQKKSKDFETQIAATNEELKRDRVNLQEKIKENNKLEVFLEKQQDKLQQLEVSIKTFKQDKEVLVTEKKELLEQLKNLNHINTSYERNISKYKTVIDQNDEEMKGLRETANEIRQTMIELKKEKYQLDHLLEKNILELQHLKDQKKDYIQDKELLINLLRNLKKEDEEIEDVSITTKITEDVAKPYIESNSESSWFYRNLKEQTRVKPQEKAKQPTIRLNPTSDSFFSLTKQFPETLNESKEEAKDEDQ